MFHTPFHKVRPTLPQAGTIENRLYGEDALAAAAHDEKPVAKVRRFLSEAGNKAKATLGQVASDAVKPASVQLRTTRQLSWDKA